MPVVEETPADHEALEPAESGDALRRREGVSRGLVRLARRLIRDAVHHCEHPEDADRTEDIHQIRVQCKRLRALLRLLKPVTDEKIIAEENTRVRDAARNLADFRDAFVAGETLKRVFDDAAPRRVRDAAVLLNVRPGGARHKGDLAAILENLARDLRRVQTTVRKLPFATRGWGALAPGLERSYRRARTSFQKCHKHQHKHFAETFHEWRKRVKDLAYQLEFLDNMDRGVLRRQRKECRRLGTLLGDDHDYVVFAEHVRDRERHYEHLATFQPVRKRLRRRLKELRAREFALAFPLFADEPEMWIAHLEGLWQKWKNPRRAEDELETPEVPLAVGAGVPELRAVTTPATGGKAISGKKRPSLPPAAKGQS